MFNTAFSSRVWHGVCLAIFLVFGLGLRNPGMAVEPLGVPDPRTIDYPNDAPPSQEEVELGKMLFFDKRLSSNDKLSCASCHNPDLGFGDGMAAGMGTLGNKLGRNTPHIYNLAWNTVFFWDGRAASLEQQALGPIQAPGEMNMPLDQLVPKLQQVPFYVKTFAEVYPKLGMMPETIARAIAAFERTLISNNSPFDRYMQGDTSAMSPAAIRGLQLFIGKANCVTCHSGPNLTDQSFHNIGVGGQDSGRATVIKDPSLMGAFKTPGLRNALLTAPYMHDGSVPTLEEVVRFYNAGGKHRQGVSELIKPLQLTEHEIFDLVAFLGALSDPIVIKRPRIPADKQISAQRD
jgi:cytochrome c peroxidase